MKQHPVHRPTAEGDVDPQGHGDARYLAMFRVAAAQGPTDGDEGERGEVEGVTEFQVGKKPRVLINRQLSEGRNMENRLRTTLAHEYGHVHLCRASLAHRDRCLLVCRALP